MQSNIVELSRHTVPVRDESDVYAAVGLGRKLTTKMGFGPGAQACAQTIIAELARNALRHAGGGTVELRALKQETRRGLEIVVQDHGPGIPNVPRALEGAGACPAVLSGAPSRAAGLGVGLSSARRLADEFTIDSVVGSGTRIRAIKWDSPDPADNRSVGARSPRPLSRRNK